MCLSNVSICVSVIFPCFLFREVNCPLKVCEENLSAFSLTSLWKMADEILKVGFADQEAPQSVFASVVGHPVSEPIPMTSAEPFEFGDRAMARSPFLKLKYPKRGGVIKRWDDEEKILEAALKSELRVSKVTVPVLITESIQSSKEQREKLARILFEKCKVPSLYIASSPRMDILGVLNKHKPSGIVLDIGDGSCEVCPFHKGSIIREGIIRSPLGGRAVNDLLRFMLIKKGHPFVASSNVEAVREIKERECYVALDYEAELQKSVNEVSSNYSLGGCETIVLGRERFKAPELLFSRASRGIDKLVYDSIMRCDPELRKDILKHVILCGGSSLFKGLPERLKKELLGLFPDVRVHIHAPPERKYMTYIGARNFAQHSHFKNGLVTRDEFLKNPAVLHKKCKE